MRVSKQTWNGHDRVNAVPGLVQLKGVVKMDNASLFYWQTGIILCPREIYFHWVLFESVWTSQIYRIITNVSFNKPWPECASPSTVWKIVQWLLWKCSATWHRALVFDQVHLAKPLGLYSLQWIQVKMTSLQLKFVQVNIKMMTFSANYGLRCRAVVRPSEMFPSHPECFVFPWEWIQTVGNFASNMCFLWLIYSLTLEACGNGWIRHCVRRLSCLVMAMPEASLTVLSSHPHIAVNLTPQLDYFWVFSIWLFVVYERA